MLSLHALRRWSLSLPAAGRRRAVGGGLKLLLGPLVVLGAAWSPPSAALTVPSGWTEVAPGRALLIPAEPGRGELRELRMSGGSGEPEELILGLRALGLPPSGFGREAQAVSLSFPDRVGRARVRLEGGVAIWVVVLASPAAAASLDPDAVLVAALAPTELAWGAVTPLAGGGDGSVWGAGAAPAVATWDPGAAEPWSLDSGLVGSWSGSALIQGRPVTVELRFDSSGRATLVQKTERMNETHSGSWSTRRGLLRLTVPGGGEGLTYELMGSTLSLDYGGGRVAMHRS